MIRAILLILITLCCSVVTAEELQVNEIYETYLPANKLVPVLEPMLGPEDRITSFRNKLFVKAPRVRQDKLLEILEEIDRPLRNILIQVRYGTTGSQQQRSRATDIKIQNAGTGVHIETGKQEPNRIVVYKGSSQNDKIEVSTVAKNHFTTENDDSISQIRVLEGNQGFLQVGEEIPQQHFILLNPNGYGTTTEYRMVGNGLYVVPQIVKDKVRLELFTTQQKRKQGNANVVQKTDAQSVLLVEPDVWTPFAGSSTSTQQQSDSHTISTRDLKQRSHNLELKVTILE